MVAPAVGLLAAPPDPTSHFQTSSFRVSDGEPGYYVFGILSPP
jgi:hypothetical protein